MDWKLQTDLTKLHILINFWFSKNRSDIRRPRGCVLYSDVMGKIGKIPERRMFMLPKVKETMERECTTWKMKFSIKDFFCKCDQIRRKLLKKWITEEILNGKVHFLCSDEKKTFHDKNLGDSTKSIQCYVCARTISIKLQLNFTNKSNALHVLFLTQCLFLSFY